MLRTIVTVFGVLQALVAGLAVANALFSGSDPATRGLDQAAGLLLAGLFLVSGAPALVLAYLNRWLGAALVIAVLPVTAAILFMVVALAR